MRCLALAVVVFITAPWALAQSASSAPVASDPQAVSLAKQSVAALTSGATIADVTVTANVISTSGSDDENGTGTFSAKGTGESRVDLILSTGTRTEIRDSQTGSPKGAWLHDNQNSRAINQRNCTTDAVWFFPALTSLGGRPDRLLKYVGQETRNVSLFSISARINLIDNCLKHSRCDMETLTAIDFYLDPTRSSWLPFSFSVSSRRW